MAEKVKLPYAKLYARYIDKHKALVEPVQGWDSLNKGLWLAYSMGRKRGFTDLGTYANKPLDHGYWPSNAFDLGRRNFFFHLGFRYITARRFAKFLWENHEALHIDYIILGDKIISRRHPEWRYYGPDKSHFFHIHVSGIYRDEPRPGDA